MNLVKQEHAMEYAMEHEEKKEVPQIQLFEWNENENGKCGKLSLNKIVLQSAKVKKFGFFLALPECYSNVWLFQLLMNADFAIEITTETGTVVFPVSLPAKRYEIPARPNSDPISQEYGSTLSFYGHRIFAMFNETFLKVEINDIVYRFNYKMEAIKSIAFNVGNLKYKKYFEGIEIPESQEYYDEVFNILREEIKDIETDEILEWEPSDPKKPITADSILNGNLFWTNINWVRFFRRAEKIQREFGIPLEALDKAKIEKLLERTDIYYLEGTIPPNNGELKERFDRIRGVDY